MALVGVDGGEHLRELGIKKAFLLVLPAIQCPDDQ